MDRDGRLRVGDRLVSVNGIELSDMTHSEAVNVLRASKGLCKILVEPDAESKLLMEAGIENIPFADDSTKLIDDRVYGRNVIGETSFPSSTTSTKSGRYSQDFATPIMATDSDNTILFDTPASGSTMNSSNVTGRGPGDHKLADEQSFFNRHALLTEVCAAVIGAAVLGSLAYLGYKRFS